MLFKKKNHFGALGAMQKCENGIYDFAAADQFLWDFWYLES